MPDTLVSLGDGSGGLRLLLDSGTAGYVPIGPAARYDVSTADKLVKNGPGVFYGVIVTVALSAAAVEIRDSTTAGAGSVIAVIPASSAIGTKIDFGGIGVDFATGLFADFGGTGTITVLYA